MNLLEKHNRLVAELAELKVNFQAVAVRLGGPTEAQKEIDRVGVILIELEERSGVAEARRIREHELTFAGDLERFESMLEKYSAPLALSEMHPGIDGAELDERLADRARLVVELKRSVATLKRMAADVDARRKKLTKEALAIAAAPDALGKTERENFVAIYNADRPNRATREAFGAITKQELATA